MFLIYKYIFLFLSPSQNVFRKMITLIYALSLFQQVFIKDGTFDILLFFVFAEPTVESRPCIRNSPAVLSFALVMIS